MRRALLLFSCVLFPTSLAAQSLLERSPNVSGGWVGAPGTIYFNFLHRFTSSGPPERQVTNYPTFLLGYAPFDRTLLGVNYSTRSDVAPRFPNEYEVFLRYAPFDILAVQAGYNNAAESFDGEVTAHYTLGRVRLLAAARGFSNGYASDDARFAIAGGATVKLGRWVALAGDVAQLLDAGDGEELAWAGALQLAIPYTPHTFSLQAANTSTATLQGSSRGLDDVRYGFEFTVPLTLSRFFGRSASTEVDIQTNTTLANADMHALQFRPGTIRVRAGTAVVWRNRDQVVHTVTAADGSWTSPMIEAGGTYRRVFDAPGSFSITCQPHPAMKMVVEVVL